MIVLPVDAADEAILAAVREWVAALASGDFAAAFGMTAHDPYYRWTPDLVRDVIVGYGLPEPAPDGIEHRVTPVETAEVQDVHPRHEVTRWGNPRNAGNGRDAIGEVVFDLPLDGAWSDLTATFEIQQGSADVVLVLHEIHAFQRNGQGASPMSTPQDDAVSYFTQGYNCAQAVLLAHGPRLGIKPADCLRLAAPFGAGMARTGSTCGAVTGALMVIGLRVGHTVADDLATKERCYEVARDFLARFHERHGSVICKELLGFDLGTPEGLAEARARDLHTTVCTGLARTAVELLGQVLGEPAR